MKIIVFGLDATTDANSTSPRPTGGVVAAQRVTREMVGQIPVSSLIDELAPKDSGQPELASLSSPEPTDLRNKLRPSSSMLSDIEGKQLLPALTARTSTPQRRSSALSVGIVLYLLSVGVVATATVGVFYGIAFFSLAQTTGAMNANAPTREHGVDAQRRIPHAPSNMSSTYGASASLPIKPESSRSAATAVLPVVSVPPPVARPSSGGDVPASDVKDQSLGKRALESGARETSANTVSSAVQTAEAAPGSSVAVPAPEAAREASPNAAPSAVQTAEPAPGSPVAAPASERAPRLTAAQIAELLARGDSFLHAGDVASARLFYKRAADSGDWQSAIRMGATFDPAFLDRAGVRTVGDPTKAQSWYRHALDLGAPKTDRQVESPQTK